MEFTYHLPVNLLFGRGKADTVGAETAKYGKRALVVTGRGSTKKSGLLDRVLAQLKAAGVAAVLFDRVAQNPLTTTAYDGAQLALEENCDVVLGVGGGSIMDAAKAIAFIACNSGDISDYIFGLKVSDRALPIVLVPTTCGTGSEGNGFAVLTNPETKDKKSLRCNAIVAKASIIDPELMKTLPKTVLASVGFDALCHNMEAYLSKIGQPLTDVMALEGIRLVGESLLCVYGGDGSDEDWEKLTLASTLGGMVINTAGITAPHGMEHPVSGLRDVVHGKGLAALTPVIIDASIGGAPEKFALISRLLGGRDEYDCADRVRALLAALDLRVTLGELGVLDSDVPWMAENCLKVSAAGLNNSPVVFGLEDLKKLYKKSIG